MVSNLSNISLPPANVVCEGYVFTRVCHSVHRWGACVFFRGGMPGFFGGMHGFFGGAWFFWGVRVFFGRGWHAWFFGGACVVFSGGVHGFLGGMHGFFGFFGCIGYNEIPSMSGRYASYWNAFLLI